MIEHGSRLREAGVIAGAMIGGGRQLVAAAPDGGGRRQTDPAERRTTTDLAGPSGYRKCAPGELLAQCWCQRGYVPVPEADVWEGRTGSCGRPGCGPC